MAWKRDFRDNFKRETEKRKEIAKKPMQNLIKMTVASRKIPKIK